MSRAEWIKLAEIMRGNWPSATLPDTAIAVQYEDVEDTPYPAAAAALRDLKARDFPPNAAQIARRAAELSAEPEPDFDQVRSAFNAMLKADRNEYGADHSPGWDAWERHGYHDRIIVFFDAGRWRQWCLTPVDDTTFYAQQRDEYRAQRGRAERERQLIAASVDREQLQRRDGLRKIGSLTPQLNEGGQR